MVNFKLDEMQEGLRALAHEFALDEIRPNAEHWDENSQYPKDAISAAHDLGILNLHIPEQYGGMGLGCIEEVLVNEELAWGDPGFATAAYATALACAPLITGATDEQKEIWLRKVAEEGQLASYAVTEPGAGSDVAACKTTAVLDGDEYVINGEKWWTSGAGDPRCKIIIFMCVTNPDNPKHQRHSMILVPMETEGVEIKKMMHVFGYDDAPHGHAHMKFTNVRVPKENLLLGEGRGFEIAQGRLGPGRIHHCMRAIGAGEVALELMCKRGIDPNKVAFGKNLAQLGANFDYIAESRIELNAARFLTLDAAVKMDTVGNKVAASEIAQIKVFAPNVALKIIDRAIQIHGGEGVSQLTPLASMYAHMRTLRLADGPDEVHRRAVARYELGKYMSQ